MNRAVRGVGITVTALLLVLVGQLTFLQVVDAKKLADDPRNSRTFLRDYTRPRGQILSADGQVLATSVPSHDEFQYQRVYPLGSLFSQVVGYQSIRVGNTGVEKYYNTTLTGQSLKGVALRDLGSLLLSRDRTQTVVLSLRVDAQELARKLLGNQSGSVVALDPRTGAILAMYSNPSFNPTSLATHDSATAQQAFNTLNADPANPALSRAYREVYPAGSTFKVITASVALANGTATPSTTFPVVRDVAIPGTTRKVANFGNEACGGTLADAFRNSCNTSFAALGVEIGAPFVEGMEAFGLNQAPPLDLSPGAEVSSGLTPDLIRFNTPLLAQAAIGQQDIRVTPLEMALVASAIADRGTIMAPHVGTEIRDSKGHTIRTITPLPWKQATTPAIAQTVTGFMVSVVQNGTGTAGQIPGIQVAGKTGTAQHGDNVAPHAWFIAFAPAEHPTVAVAVLVEDGGTMGSEATGGKVAAPIAAQLMTLLLGK